MKRLQCSKFWLLLLIIGYAQAETQDSSKWQLESAAAKRLTQINQKLTDAYQKEDITFLRKALADAHVHNNVFGRAMTKDQFLKDIETGILEFKTYKTPKLKWYIDGNTAIATGEIAAKAVRDGKSVPATRFLFTRVYIKENSDWKVLLFHNTMMP